MIEKTKRKSSILGGAFALTLSVIIVKIIGFIYKLPLSRILGDEGMGYFNSAYSIFTFFYLICTSGVPRAVAINISGAEAFGREDEVEKIFGTTFRFFISIGVIFTLLLLLFSERLAALIGNSLAGFSLFCIAPSLTFVSAMGVLRGYMNGKGRVTEIAVSEVIEGLIKFIVGLAFAVIALKRGLGYPMIAAYSVLGVTLGSFVGALFLYICSKNSKTREKQRQNLPKNSLSKREILKNVFKISIPITLSSAVVSITNLVDLSFIMRGLTASGMSAAEASAAYGNYTTLATPMLTFAIALIAPLGTAAMPYLAGAYKTGDFSGFEKNASLILKLCGLMCIPMGFAFLFFSEEILMLLFEDSSAMMASASLSILSASVFFLPLLTIINTVLESALHTGLSLFSMLLGAAVKIFACYVLIGKMGIVGAPLSTGIGYGVSLLISGIFMLQKLKLRISTRALWSSFLISLLTVGGMFLLYNKLFASGFEALNFIVCMMLCVVVYLLFVCIFMRSVIFEILNFVKIAKK